MSKIKFKKTNSNTIATVKEGYTIRCSCGEILRCKIGTEYLETMYIIDKNIICTHCHNKIKIEDIENYIVKLTADIIFIANMITENDNTSLPTNTFYEKYDDEWLLYE